MRINRNNKDRLFRFIFGDPEHKERTLELYNALNGSDYENPDQLEVRSTEGVLYLSMKNDVCFLIDTELDLWEHQSTWNPNMPLRGLLYFSQQYNLYVKEEDLNLYANKKLKLPTPRYFVFFNGDRELPDETVLRFSDSVAKPEQSSIEVTARVLNINADHNQVLMEASRNLRDYAELIRRLKQACADLKDEDEILAATTLVVDRCIQEGILCDILIQNKNEVIDMFLTEYDEKETMRRQARDNREEGRKEGRVALKKATEYLKENGRASEIEKLNLDDNFFISVIKEAGIEFEESSAEEA
jgi:hypothetical protein